MGSVIAIANQKGGVGKTTTSINLCAGLSACDRRVLLVDLDPQGNATMGAGVNKATLSNTINEALLDEISPQDALVTSPNGFDVLPANKSLTVAEVKLLQMPRRELRLRQVLSRFKDSYDYVIIDCPPSLNMLTVNALVAADGVIITMQCEYYALEGLSGLIDTIQQISASLNPRLHVYGILRTMYDGRSCLTQDVSKQLVDHFGDRVYRTVIPRNIRLAEAPSYGLSVIAYDKRSNGAQAYLNLAQEIIEKPLQTFAPVVAETAIS
ncbi:MAG: ParA family protein [Legionellales bacterium]|nr:ParA family protein [Legionellales bacterium]